MQSAPGWPSSPRTVSPARWPPGGRRDEVIFRLLLDTGVRVSELCGLKLEDVDLDRELAYVVGKGSRPRVVPFSAKTAQAIDRYLRIRALHAQASSPKLLLG